MKARGFSLILWIALLCCAVLAAALLTPRTMGGLPTTLEASPAPGQNLPQREGERGAYFHALPGLAWPTLGGAQQAEETIRTPAQSRGQVYLANTIQRMQAGDLAGARAMARAWLSELPADAQASLWNGLLGMVDDPQAGLANLNQAVLLDPGLAPTVAALQQAQSTSAGESYRLVATGRALGTLGYWELAAQAFERGVQLAPDYAEAWALWGQAQQQLGRDGYPALQQAESLNPSSVIVRAALGLYWREQGDDKASLGYFQALAEQETANCIWQVELARTYTRMGSLDTALALLQHAVQLEPQNPDCWRELANFSITQGLDLSGSGLPAARQVLALSPGQAASYDLMGRALLAQGDEANAEKFLLKALAVQESYLPAHLHLAQIYLLRGGDVAQARQHLLRVMELAPGSDYAQAAANLWKEYQLQ